MHHVSSDVLVTGGGVSGVAAAVAAARQGMRTCLFEREDSLGGIGYFGLLRHLCGLYLNGDNTPTETLNGGLAGEVVAILHTLSPEKTVKKIGRVYVLPYSREDLRSVFDSLCRAESNLQVCLNTNVVSVRKNGERIAGVTAVRAGAEYEIVPDVVIDCSGNGEVSAMAGADFEVSPQEKLQLAAYVLHIKGLKDYDESLRLKVPWCLAEAVKNGILSPELRFSVFIPGDGPDEGYLKISVSVSDDFASRQRAAADALSVYAYLSDRLDVFRGSCIVETSKGFLEREGRRIRGEHTLTEEDILCAKKFPDGIVRNSWPIELWDKMKGTIYRYVKKDDYYEIPFGCLQVKGIENLLCAGRCISVSHEALGSTRVMGTCISLGEQAGMAAARKVRSGHYLSEKSGHINIMKKGGLTTCDGDAGN
jgi:FAD dependent oxidoreductase